MHNLALMEARHSGTGEVAIKRAVVKTPTVDWDNRLVQGIISTENVDLDGEVVVQSGIDTTYFLGADKDSGVRTVYLDHDYSKPVGSCVNLKLTSGGLYASTYISKTALGEEVLTLIDEGIIRGQSIGYRRVDSSDPDHAEVQKYGHGCDRVTRKSMLLEFSMTPMPCNPDAMLDQVKTLVGQKRLSQKTADLILPREDSTRMIVVTAGGCYTIG